MKKFHILFTLLFAVSFFSVFSQKGKTIKETIQHYRTYKNADLIKAYEYTTQAVQISKELNDSSYLSASYQYQGDALYRLGKMNAAEEAVNNSLAITLVKKNKKILALNYLLKSKIEIRRNNSSQALELIEKALKIATQENFINLIYKIKINKAILLKKTKNNQKAYLLLHSLLKNSKNIEDDRIAEICTSIAISNLKKHKDSSVYYYKKALELSRKTKNRRLERKIAGNLGKVLMVKKEYNEAHHYLELSQKIAVEISDFAGLYYTNISLALYYELQHDYDTAIQQYLKANEYVTYVSIAKKAHLYWLLSGALWHNKQFEKGYDYQEKYILLKDSLFTIEKNKTFEKLQTEYEVEKKNDQIQFLEKEQLLEAKQKKLIYSIGGLLVIALILAVFIYRYRVKSQKVIRQQELLIYKREKEQLEQTQKIKKIEGYIEGEEKEKNRIALELHDGIGGQLSGIKHFVSALQQSNQTKELFDNITSVSKEVRVLSHSLSSNYSIQQPLETLLTTLKDRYQNHFDIQIHLFPEDEIKKMPNTKKLFLYRTIQELINNTYKYANASLIDISITISDEIVLIVEDNGIGFATENIPTGIGLQNIKERVQNVKGEFVLDSVLGNGTSIIIKIPKKDGAN